MSWEIFKDSQGSTTDSEGRPYNESLTQQEGRRLHALKHWSENHPDGKERIPLTDVIPQIHVIDRANKGSMGEFFDRHRRRGPYVTKNPYQPGI